MRRRCTYSNMDHVRSSNKIRQIVRLQQLLKKWKKIAAASASSTHLHSNNSNGGINKLLKKTLSFSDRDKEDLQRSSNNGGINKLLKKTLSFSDKEENSNNVPKGCLAVLCVGKEEEKRFVIPMDYLAHQSFQLLLREAEEEFGFQQQGILKIPCQLSLFHNILKNIQYDLHHDKRPTDNIHNLACCSPENHQHPSIICTT